MSPPNVLLIMTDQQRWDACSLAGRLPVRTPHIEHLARQGAWFPETYVQAPICVPSRMSLISGRYPHQHGCVDNHRSLWPDAPSFVRSTRDAGYRTACVGKLHYTWQHDLEILATEPLLDALGFDDPCETTGKMSMGNIRVSAYSEHLRNKGLMERFRADLLQRVEEPPAHTRPSILSERDHIDGWVVDRAADWIDAYQGDDPFLLWVGIPGPHDPFDPPEPYASMYDPDEMPLGSLESLYRLEDHRPFTPLPDATQAELKQMRAHYLGNVTFIDAGIGRLVDALRRGGHLQDTWVIVTSDHGEMLGDHRMLGKGQFQDASARVPLIMRPPASAGLERGVVGRGLVELIDLTATMLDVTGATLEGCQGRSLLDPARGWTDTAVHRDAVVSQMPDRAMVRDRRFKLVVSWPELTPMLLWDLEQDPEELVNLAERAASADVIERLRGRLERLVRDAPVDLPEPWQHRSPYRDWPHNPMRRHVQAAGSREAGSRATAS
jgi:arylsulfatase